MSTQSSAEKDTKEKEPELLIIFQNIISKCFEKVQPVKTEQYNKLDDETIFLEDSQIKLDEEALAGLGIGVYKWISALLVEVPDTAAKHTFADLLFAYNIQTNSEGEDGMTYLLKTCMHEKFFTGDIGYVFEEKEKTENLEKLKEEGKIIAQTRKREKENQKKKEKGKSSDLPKAKSKTKSKE